MNRETNMQRLLVELVTAPHRGNPSPARVVTLTIRLAILLGVATAVAQLVDFKLLDLRVRALDSTTHRSIFGAVSLLANGTAVAIAFSLAARGWNRERALLAGILSSMLALRVSNPPHILVISLPLAGTALLILWRQGFATAERGWWLIRAGCALLVISFLTHALEVQSLFSFATDRETWAYQLRCLAKHIAELAGWVLIAGGLLNVRTSIDPLPSRSRAAVSAPTHSRP